MYKTNSIFQPELPNFYLPFGGKLKSNNRWVKLSVLIPWDEVERQYAMHFNCFGRRALSSRVAFGALIIKEKLNLSDRETVEQIGENPYLQYFLGFGGFVQDLPFDASCMVHFRKRFSLSMIAQINESLCLKQTNPENRDSVEESSPGADKVEESSPGADKVEESSPGADKVDIEEAPVRKNQGQLIIDASCTPADISYPTDLKLLNESREKTEQIIDKLHAQHQGKKKPRTYRRIARKDFLSSIKNKRPSKKFRRKAIKKQLSYLERNLAHIEKLKEETGLSGLGRVLYNKLLIINEIYRQQKDLYERQSTSIADRIVSLSQPHVRPIVRGKVGKKYEFGAKISISICDGYSFLDRFSWDAYNESEDLIGQVEAFERRQGHYPESVHADQIYRNRKNRAYCKRLGIRLSGKPLGRPPKDQNKNKAIQKQIRQDEAVRNAAEGKFGQGKRRFGLDNLMTKLAHTSECVVALVIFVMNMEKRLASIFLAWFKIYCASNHTAQTTKVRFLLLLKWLQSIIQRNSHCQSLHKTGL